MQCLDRFNKRMSYSGGSLRNEYIFNTRKLLEETFADDPSFMSDIYFWKLGLKEYEDYSNETPIGIRLYGRSFSAAQGVTIKFQSLYDVPIVVGDIVYDAKEDEYLICTESFNIDDIHYKGKFTLCNWMLKWQKKDGTILEYPCYDMNSTQYNSGEQPNRNFIIGSSQHMITLPSDENTIALNTPQRFYLDKNIDNPTTFIVTQNDTTSHNYGKKGLVKVTVYESQNNPATDRPDLGICDYIDVDKMNTDSIRDIDLVETVDYNRASKVVIEYSTNVIKSGGDSQKFAGKFYDNNENEVTGIVPIWDIVCISSNFKDKLQWKKTDNYISIWIDDDDCIDEEFKLICSCVGSSTILPSSLIIKIESLL